jgi:hypothetical protein
VKEEACRGENSVFGCAEVKTIRASIRLSGEEKKSIAARKIFLLFHFFGVASIYLISVNIMRKMP